MTVTLAFRFPAGRYHATPFGHHVNEGLIEWPPSPWRLLRALISIGYTSGLWDSHGLPLIGQQLFKKLAAELPNYYLPPVSGAHSRHYMPIGTLDKNKIEKTTLVIDTWGQIKGQELIITWDVALGNEEIAMLADLVERLGYLGRSESWIIGRLILQDETIPESNCYPEQQGVSPGPGWEQVAMLAAVDTSDFDRWRAEYMSKVWANLPLPEGRKPSKKLQRDREKAAGPFPVDLLDCLQKDTNWLRRHGWSQPPGSRRVFYWRRTDAIKISAPRVMKITLSTQPVEAMLLSLTNTSRNDHALPSVTRTLPQADLLHKALIGVAAKNSMPSSVLTGCDDRGKPLKGPHEHAHISPLDLDGDNHLDHILIWAPMGLDSNAQAAIRAIRRTFTKGGIEPLRLALAASGDLKDLGRIQKRYGRRLNQIVALDGATAWESLTPFVPPRFIKTRGKNTLEGQLRAELHSRKLPEPVSVSQIATGLQPLVTTRLEGSTTGYPSKVHDMTRTHFRHFVLSRRNGPQPPVRCGFTMRIEFQYPVKGPVALGYASHFGLGLFTAIDSQT